MSWLFPSGGQHIRASVSLSVLPVNIQGWLPLGLTGWISLQSKGPSSTTVQQHQFFSTQPSLWSNSHICMTTGKIIALTIQTFVSKVMSLLFNRLSRFVIAFLAVSRHLIHDDGIFEYIVKWLPALLYIHQLVMLQFFFLWWEFFASTLLASFKYTI